MNRGIVKLGELLPGWGLPEPPTKEDRPPIPKPPKVIGDPTREPVNRQAALLIAPASWIHKPLPPQTAPVSELETLRAENATLKATNSNLVAENSALRRRVERLSKLTVPKPVHREPPPPVIQQPSNKQKVLERLNAS